MCLGVPAQVVDIPDPESHIATVQISGIKRDISIALLDQQELVTDPVQVNDWVLVHVGFAMSKIDEAEAEITLEQIKRLGGNTFEDELDAFKDSAIL